MLVNCRLIEADDVVGIWLTGGDHPAKVQVYKSGEKYYGKIVWLQSTVDNKPMVDLNNPDDSKKNQPIIGLIILRSFEFERENIQLPPDPQKCKHAKSERIHWHSVIWQNRGLDKK